MHTSFLLPSVDSVPASRDTPGTLPAIMRKDSGGAPTGAPGEEKVFF